MDRGGGAGSKRGKRGLERVTGADRHELAGLRGEEIADRSCVGSPYGDARQDQSSCIDGIRVDAGQRGTDD